MTEGNVSAGVPTTPPNTDAGSAPTTPDFLSFVPEAYREDPTVKDAAKSDKPFEAFFESFKYAQSQVGKQTGLQVPGEGATEEQVKAFHKSLGVPDTVDGYEYSAPDISQEAEELQTLLKGDEQSAEYMKSMKEIALKAGITPAQFKTLAAASDSMRLEQARQMFKAAEEIQTQRAAQQEEMFKKVYGDQAEYVKRIAKETIAKILPKEVADTKDDQIALYHALKFIHEKVYKNDPVAIGGASSGGTASGAAGIQAEIDKLTKEKSYTDRMDPSYDTVQKKVQELYVQLAAELKK